MTTKVKSPAEIVAELAPAYQEWKGGEKSKNKLKDEFFEAITAELAQGELAEQIILVEDAATPQEGEEWIEKRNPFWEVTDFRANPEPDGMGYEYIITERPEYKDFYIDFDGKTYGRQVAQGPTLIDEEEIEENDPEFFWEITEFQDEKIVQSVIDFLYDTSDDVERFEALMSYGAEMNLKRVLKPIDELSPDQLAKLQPYSYQGKPVVKLPAPKKAKD
jgi:hypothetical protein